MYVGIAKQTGVGVVGLVRRFNTLLANQQIHRYFDELDRQYIYPHLVEGRTGEDWVFARDKDGYKIGIVYLGDLLENERE